MRDQFTEDLFLGFNNLMKHKIVEPYFYIYRFTVGLLTQQKSCNTNLFISKMYEGLNAAILSNYL